MPNDADSLTEPIVDGDSTDDASNRADSEPVADDQTQAHAAIDAEVEVPDSDDASERLVTLEDLEDSDEPSAGAEEQQTDDADELVTVEDLGDSDQLITAEDLAEGDDFSDDELLFDGDPEEFELDFGDGALAGTLPGAGDMLVLDEPDTGPGPRPRQMSRLERRRRVRLQARRVRRIIRHIEPWSVLKISILFYACLWVIFLVAGFMIWGVAESSGTVGKIESLVTQLFALETFDFDAGQIFRGYALGGLALAIAGTTLNVLMCLLFNLISDLTGGLRITMIEEETARPTPPRRRRRRPPPQRR